MTNQPVDVMDAYQAAVRGQDPEAYVALFHDDLFWGPNGFEPTRSLEALRTAAEGMLSRFAFDPAFQIEHIDVHGDLAVVVVHEHGSMTPVDGEPRRTDLTEMFVLKRRDGVWKISRQIWSGRSPPTPR